jgi:hypothetical protein
MMSYPNGPAVHKSLDRPDMHVLAALAEGAGLDLRILVLLRDAAAVLNSTVDKRHFGALEAPALVANAESMHAQLCLLDAGFYRCMRYEDLTERGLTHAQKRALVHFLHPRLLSVAVLDRMLTAVRRTPPSIPTDTQGLRDIGYLNSTSGTSSSRSGEKSRAAARVSRRFQEQQLQSRQDLISSLCTNTRAWL